LDCLEALRARAHDQEVRSALLSAARRDQNPAVRLKALEALRDSFAESDVRETLLQALKNDSNPGVRVEAVNLLVRSVDDQALELSAPVIALGSTPRALNGTAAANDSMESVIRALEEMQRNDPDRYVRLRTAAALRQISARNDH
jgi:HEAT repeat protein